MARTPTVGLDLGSVEWKTVEEVYAGAGFQTTPGELIALLNVDPDTGGTTVLVRLPPGFRTDAPERHSCLQEEVLLEGDVTIGDREIVAPAYLCFPPGFPHGPLSSRSGALVLATHDGPVDAVYG